MGKTVAASGFGPDSSEATRRIQWYSRYDAPHALSETVNSEVAQSRAPPSLGLQLGATVDLIQSRNYEVDPNKSKAAASTLGRDARWGGCMLDLQADRYAPNRPLRTPH